MFLIITLQILVYRAWSFREEEDTEVIKFLSNRGHNKPCRCEQLFQPPLFRVYFDQKWVILLQFLALKLVRTPYQKKTKDAMLKIQYPLN